MVGQVEAVFEALATAWTRVGFEGSVPGEVTPKVRAVAEALATLTAVKRNPGSSSGRRWGWGRGRDRGHWQRGISHDGVVGRQWRMEALSGAGRRHGGQVESASQEPSPSGSLASHPPSVPWKPFPLPSKPHPPSCKPLPLSYKPFSRSSGNLPNQR